EAVVEVDVVELAARPDLEVLGQFGLVRQHAGGDGQDVDEAVDLPHGVAGVLDDAAEAEQVGHDRPVLQQAAPVDAAGAAGGEVDPLDALDEAGRVANGGVGEGQDEVAERRRLGLLRGGRVGQDRVE